MEVKRRTRLDREITIILPSLNEAEGIEKTIRSIPRKPLEDMGYKVQILVVDNGSTDNTGELARKAGAEVVFEPRRGYGRAYKTGFAHARGDIIATADADLTYPVEDLPKLARKLDEEQLDFLTTNRFGYSCSGVMSFEHRVGNLLLSIAGGLLFGMNVRDSQSGMWIFRKRILKKMVLRFDTMAFSEELKIEACHFGKCRWKEVPIEYRHRVGASKISSWRDGCGNLVALLQKRARRGSAEHAGFALELKATHKNAEMRKAM
jgi:dolichol-phosphate hexosyltransferase